MLGRVSGILCILPLLLTPLCLGRVGPGGVIRTICFGDVVDQYGGFNSYVVVRNDPAIDTTLVPTRPGYLGSVEAALRNMRIYMPRSYQNLIDEQDLIVTSDTDRGVFSSQWIDWLARSVTDGGLSLEWLGSIKSNNFESWEGTTLANIAPVRPGGQLDLRGSFKLIIQDRDEELMNALPWDKAPPLLRLNTQIPRGEGEEVWATSNTPRDYPFLTYWEIGQGSVLCFATKFPNGLDLWVRDWPYFQQSMIYMVYRASGKDLPSDPSLMQHIYSLFFEYGETESTVFSVISFVEDFGGQVQGLHRRMDEMSDMKIRADRAYMEARYDECVEIMTEIGAEQNSIMEAALEARDSALLWVYIIEWCAVSGALLMAGFFLWAVMIRRRLYREVRTTKTHER